MARIIGIYPEEYQNSFSVDMAFRKNILFIYLSTEFLD